MKTRISLFALARKQKSLSKEIKDINKNQTEMLELKNSIGNMKKSMSKFKCRMEAGGKNSKIENTQSEQQGEMRLRKSIKQDLKDVWDTNEGSAFYVLRVLEGEEKEDRAEKAWKIYNNNGWKFPKADPKHKRIDLRNWVNPKYINPKKSTSRHIIARLLKMKGKRGEKKVQCLYGKLIIIRAYFSSETMETREKQPNIFQENVGKKRTANPEFSIQLKYPSGMKGELRHSQMKEKWREFVDSPFRHSFFRHSPFRQL